MSRAVIQIGADQVAYDGRKWEPVSGERAEDFAHMMKASEGLYKQKASSHPDFVYNVAIEAAEEWDGEVVQYQPDNILVPVDAVF